MRGYWAIVSGCAFYATQLPARHLRENWVGLAAPGPRLLRMAAPSAVVVMGLNSGAALAAWPNEPGFGLGQLALLLPGMAVSVAALALAIGVGWTLARNPSMSRAAVGVGVLGAGLSFSFFEVVVTAANREFRVVAYQALAGPGKELRLGSREMTFRELGEAATLARVSACPTQGARPSCGGGPSPAFLRTEWHNRLSLPAFVFSFVILAASLSRSGRRAVVVPCVFFAYVAAFLLLRFGEKLGLQGDVPVALAAWIPHTVPLGLAGVVYAVMRERHHGRPLPPQGASITVS